MKFLGFEIGRAHEAAEPKKRKPYVEIGDSGTDYFQGIITEEYNSKLTGTQGIEVYDKMRKGDATVKAAVLATSLPIRRANWFIEPASDDPQDQEIAEFVSKALFEWQTITWNDLLRQALLSLPYGVMVFEKVFTTKEVDGRTWIIWKKFAPRLPKSIHAWETSDGKPGIQQRKKNGDIVDIPLDLLLIFVNDKEGDNWWGTSILRSAYKHWQFKDGFYKIDAVAFEKQGLGVPKAKLPDGYTEQDEKDAATILKNMRAHEQQFIIEPPGLEVEFMDMKGKQVRDPEKSIQHHNREIVKAVLAQFLELGATDSGSRALSSDQSDLFLQSLEAVAGNHADVFNRYAIPQLVDLNFDNVADYPNLKFKGISRIDVEALSTAYKTLTEAGGVRPTENDERHWREVLSLPERTEEDDERDEAATSKSQDGSGESEAATKKARLDAIALAVRSGLLTPQEADEETTHVEFGLPPMTEAVRQVWHDEPTRRPVTLAKSDSDTSSTSPDHVGEPPEEIEEEVNASLPADVKKKFAELSPDDFKPENSDFRRPLTFAEEKVNFKALQKAMDRFEAELTGDIRDMFGREADRFMKELSKAVNDGDYEAIKKAQLRFESAYSVALKDHLKKAYEYGKTNASREMGKKTPANPSEVMRQIDLAAATIAQRQQSELTTEAKLAANEALQKGETAAIALAAADRKLREAIETKARQTAEITVTGFINYGRRTVFERYGDDIYALQRSELLDSRTCNYCLSIDGRIVEKDDPFGRNTIFHSGCRGIWVEILLDEEDKPSIDGIPDSLRDRFGDAVNDLIQPKSPSNTQKNPEAQKEIKKRRDRRIKRQKKE